MPNTNSEHDSQFKSILNRNIRLPLISSLISAGIFISLLMYVLSVMNWVEHSELVISNGSALTKQLVDMETGLRGYLLAGDDSFLDPYRLAKPRMEANLTAQISLVSDNAAQVDRLTIIRARVGQWDAYAQNMMRMRAAGEEVTGVVRTGQGKVQFDEIRRLLDDFQDQEITLRQERQIIAKQITTTVGVLFVAMAIALGAGIAVSGHRQIKKLSESFKSAIAEKTQHNKQLAQQAWQRSAETKLAERNLTQLALPAFASTVLRFMAEYLDAKVGDMYLTEPDGTLRRIGAYGLAGLDADVRLGSGEGYVGQAAIERRIVQISPVPSGYLRISSGLGSGDPTAAVVVPLLSERTVVGVMELGWLHAVPASHLEFMETVAYHIGTAITVATARERTNELLAETQQLNEEMQFQQEELRTANEELEEQSRVLEESQVSLEQQQAELTQTNEMLGSQTLELEQRHAQLQLAQQEVRKRAEELEQAGEYKSQFMANMSHELRTPLNSSLILSKLLFENAAGNLNDEQVSFAKTIYNAGNDLLDLINDILDIAKVEAGKLELTPERVDVRDVVDSMKATFQPLANSKKLELDVSIQPGTQQWIDTDRQRLDQILKNLLSNAIKFTSKGQVRLSIDVASGVMQFNVRDTGIGISAANRHRVFEAFQQADGTTSRQYGGTGLGLAISRDLAHLLGGTLALESSVGVGSTFTLSLPLEFSYPKQGQSAFSDSGFAKFTSTSGQADTPSVTQSTSPQFEDDRAEVEQMQGNLSRPVILIVEDDVVFGQILCEMARQEGYHGVVSQTAEQGMAAAHRYQPLAILLDVGLPDQSGMLMLQQLKADLRTRHVQVHMVSAYDNAATAMQLGAAGYTLKPATKELLRTVFEAIATRSAQRAKRVLLVEDDERQRSSMTELLGQSGHIDIVEAESGEAALTHLREGLFDCIVVDLKLPDMQGNELLSRISACGLPSVPPIIIYTGRNLTRQEEDALQRYSRSIIIKGARSPERLLDEVTLFLHQQESTLSTEQRTILTQIRNREQMLEGRRILLVDDDVRNIFALTSALEKQGAVIEVARTGQEALDKLNTPEHVDLVLMDVMMPGMDGLEATRLIRRNPRFEHLPIIAVTAKATKDDQQACLAAGASDYLSKPVDLSRLYALMRVWISGT